MERLDCGKLPARKGIGGTPAITVYILFRGSYPNAVDYFTALNSCTAETNVSIASHYQYRNRKREPSIYVGYKAAVPSR